MVKSISQLVLLSLVFGACVMFSAAVSAETPTADANAGRELYKIAGGYGCGVCHGKVGDGGGQAGGRVRGATTELFNNALAIQPTMMLLVNALDAQNRADLVAYLESLALMPLVTMLMTVWLGPSFRSLPPRVKRCSCWCLTTVLRI